MEHIRSKRDEGGAILVLALVFVLIVTFSIFGLITFGGVGIQNATNLKGQRALEYAADGATSAAIQAVRYSFHGFGVNETPPVTGPVNCLPDGAILSLPDTNPTMAIPEGNATVSMSVYCIAGPTPSVPQYTRVVTFYACLQAAAQVIVNGLPAGCTPTNSIVAATVEFEDVTSAGISQCTGATNVSTCGIGEVISNWVVQTANN